MLKPGWLHRQFEKVEKDIKKWPEWMRKEAGLLDSERTKNESVRKKGQDKVGQSAKKKL